MSFTQESSRTHFMDEVGDDGIFIKGEVSAEVSVEDSVEVSVKVSGFVLFRVMVLPEDGGFGV